MGYTSRRNIEAAGGSDKGSPVFIAPTLMKKLFN